MTQDENRTFYYEDNGKRVGPFPLNDFEKLIIQKKIGPKTLIWTQGFANWVEIKDSEFMDKISFEGPPPLDGAHVNNLFVWILAFAPIIGQALKGFFAVLFIKGPIFWDFQIDDELKSKPYFLIPFAINLLLTFWDLKKLKEAGYETKAFVSYFWLVPVYLYKRAKYLKQKNTYFIVWMCCFFLRIILP